MSDRGDYFEDELSLLDIYRVLKAYWRSILIMPFALAIAALLLTWIFVTPQYEAQGLIDTGRVGEKLLEEPNILVDRLNQPSFIDRVVAEHVRLFNDSNEVTNQKHFKSFVAKKYKDSNLVSFTLLGKTLERAQLKANAVIETLAGIHQKNFDGNIELVKQQVNLVDHQIKALQDDKVPNIALRDDYDTTLKAVIANDRLRQLNELMNRKFELESNLSSTISYNTRLLDRVYVSVDPVSPNLLIVTLVAFLLGLFGAIFAAFVRNSLKA